MLFRTSEYRSYERAFPPVYMFYLSIPNWSWLSINVCAVKNNSHFLSDAQVACHNWKSLLFRYDVKLHIGMQNYMGHLNPHSLVHPSQGNIPRWVWQAVNQFLRNLQRKVWTYRHFGNWILRKWQSFCFPPKQASKKRKTSFYNDRNLQNHRN